MKQSKATNPPNKELSDAKLSRLLHDALFEKELDDLGAPKTKHGAKLSPYGRVCAISASINADRRRLEWLIVNCAYLVRDGMLFNVLFAPGGAYKGRRAFRAHKGNKKGFTDAIAAIDDAMVCYPL